MSYMALYRKWRPDEFEEVKGQEHVVTTLKNQIIHDRIGHAYLFCGTRGTGKTTVAKLFAKAVNCEHPLEDGSPCNECATCQSIGSGSSLDVVEMDAASNNGVDNIRDIRENVQYSPTAGKFKVYIIDEAHMLSGGAFNALLKTLEEPPSYVIFILATTESHKIPITIRSRCQKYDFRRIGLEVIYSRLMELLQREGIEAEEKAIRYVAKVADGSMRDALSLLDQCISYYLGQTLTYEKVLEVLGAVDVEIFNELMRYVTTNDTMQALRIVDEIIWQGRELSQFVADFTWYMRNLLLIQSSDAVSDQLDISADNLDSMKQIADMLEMSALVRYIRVFSEMSNQIRYSTQKRVTLELAIIKLTTPQMEIDTDSILERLRVLENKVEEGSFSLSEEQLAALSARQGGMNLDVGSSEQKETIDREAILKRELTPAEYEDMEVIIASIRQIKKDSELRGRIGKMTMSMLDRASINVGYDKKSIMLSFANDLESSMAYDRFQQEETRTALQSLIGELTGKQVDITCQMKDSLEEKDFTSVNLNHMKFLKNMDFDVKIED
ncbi:MAG: DNA polymerase III subunit gamma/tau [Lachnospiraceae bacterium]|nr:DNA polymerase III subunit gamma/tau [Lachnospiraceae bacterium]